MIPKEALSLVLRDRLVLVIVLIGSLLAAAELISSLLQLRVSDVQVPVRYSAYGLTNLYRDKWFYLTTFIGIGLLLTVVHPLITAKLYQARGREFAIGFGALTIIVAVIALLINIAVFRVVSFSV